eukprot:Plantae.Rhodophyta-Hildenbrandia_rubra.ctg13120.p1 GENE.Plantae.Rhodophyta-Hildenbrandia_rubra.ctg13120~~Plantae.Rhodophyta-Hildenbrandia_rubra.ctg13120.p1  ORF type:complete len:368 (-),score=30.35 Plantae.Rhodophyta-Hildenbrandia_rubra.ctg13120:941-2044(-)
MATLAKGTSLITPPSNLLTKIARTSPDGDAETVLGKRPVKDALLETRTKETVLGKRPIKDALLETRTKETVLGKRPTEDALLETRTEYDYQKPTFHEFPATSPFHLVAFTYDQQALYITDKKQKEERCFRFTDEYTVKEVRVSWWGDRYGALVVSKSGKTFLAVVDSLTTDLLLFAEQDNYHQSMMKRVEFLRGSVRVRGKTYQRVKRAFKLGDDGYVHCMLCLAKLRNHTEYSGHADRHSGTMVYCTFDFNCHSTSRYSQNALSHIRSVHEKKKPFSCPKENCHSTFARKENLEAHIRSVHEKKKPFSCPKENCHSIFSSKQNLEAHIRSVHEKKKPFSCPKDNCHSAFAEKRSLKRHIKRAHEKN